MTGTPRLDVRARNLARVTALARAQVRESGAEGLSVRAIARDMSMASSAMYRYVKSRDELLTLVIADAYRELADAVDAALADAGGETWDGRVKALGRAVRTWAIEDRASYALLYGTPLTGYVAPANVTTPEGTRVVVRIVEILRDAPAPADPSVPATLATDVANVRAEFPDIDLPDARILDAMTLWSALYGTIGFEVFGQFGPDIADPEAFFEAALDRLCRVTS